MTPEQLIEIRGLLTTERVLALAVLVDGEPYCGLLPYANMPDCSAAIVHASRLARHSRGLQHGSPFGVLIHRQDRPDADPLQIPRLTLQGTVELLDPASDAHRDARQLFAQRFPSAQHTFSLGDFDLFRLRFEKGRYVGGFAQALNLGPEDFRRLS
jgi:putative heme iron utilization protein